MTAMPHPPGRSMSPKVYALIERSGSNRVFNFPCFSRGIALSQTSCIILALPFGKACNLRSIKKFVNMFCMLRHRKIAAGIMTMSCRSRVCLVVFVFSGSFVFLGRKSCPKCVFIDDEVEGVDAAAIATKHIRMNMVTRIDEFNEGLFIFMLS